VLGRRSSHRRRTGEGQLIEMSAGRGGRVPDRRGLPGSAVPTGRPAAQRGNAVLYGLARTGVYPSGGAEDRWGGDPRWWGDEAWEGASPACLGWPLEPPRRSPSLGRGRLAARAAELDRRVAEWNRASAERRGDGGGAPGGRASPPWAGPERRRSPRRCASRRGARRDRDRRAPPRSAPERPQRKNPIRLSRNGPLVAAGGRPRASAPDSGGRADPRPRSSRAPRVARLAEDGRAHVNATTIPRPGGDRRHRAGPAFGKSLGRSEYDMGARGDPRRLCRRRPPRAARPIDGAVRYDMETTDEENLLAALGNPRARLVSRRAPGAAGGAASVLVPRRDGDRGGPGVGGARLPLARARGKAVRLRPGARTRAGATGSGSAPRRSRV